MSVRVAGTAIAWVPAATGVSRSSMTLDDPGACSAVTCGAVPVAGVTANAEGATDAERSGSPKSSTTDLLPVNSASGAGAVVSTATLPPDVMEAGVYSVPAAMTRNTAVPSGVDDVTACAERHSVPPLPTGDIGDAAPPKNDAVGASPPGAGAERPRVTTTDWPGEAWRSPAPDFGAPPASAWTVSDAGCGGSDGIVFSAKASPRLGYPLASQSSLNSCTVSAGSSEDAGVEPLNASQIICVPPETVSPRSGEESCRSHKSDDMRPSTASPCPNGRRRSLTKICPDSMSHVVMPLLLIMGEPSTRAGTKFAHPSIHAHDAEDGTWNTCGRQCSV